MASFNQSQIEAISAALGDTDDGLTGSEIEYLLRVCGIGDPAAQATKRIRLHDAFAESQNKRGDRGAILAFIRNAMKPERHLRRRERFEVLRTKLNEALAFVGYAVEASGQLVRVDQAQTIPEAERRAADLREGLIRRGIHADVLRFCRSELLVDNYFHAVLEATKSVADKLRARSGLTDDGAALVDRCLAGDQPLLTINPFSTPSEKSEQKGFANLVRGCFGMFRNPTAHEARVNWAIGKEDAEDLLSLLSLIHRRLDGAQMPPRI